MAYGPFLSASDVIAFKEIDTGGQKAGNGGNGYNSGDITNKPHINFEPNNKAAGADVDVKTGDDVYQKAYWDAGGAKGYGGTAKSNGDQESWSGHNSSKVSADTKAYQSNELNADMSQMVAAGNGGDGGHGNLAKGGDVSFALVHSNPVTEVVELSDVLNHSGRFDIDDFVNI